MQEEDDERAAQALKDYDSLHQELTEAIQFFNLPTPALFQRETNHTCITFFNKDAEGTEGQDGRKQEEKMKSAAKLIQHLVDFNKLDSLTYKKTKGFEGTPFVKVLNRLPRAVPQALNCIILSKQKLFIVKTQPNIYWT